MIIIEAYNNNQEIISLIKDIIFFLGFIGFIKFIINWRYNKKTKEIENNLNFRAKIEDKLNEYVLEKNKNKVGAGIRFVYWENYPWRLDDDAYKHALWVTNTDERTLPSGWIDNTGINFYESLFFFSRRVFIDKNGIFFFSDKNSKYKGFKAIKKGQSLVLHMPFSKIVNYDFKEYIEYEPIFYIKHKYNNWKSLYDSKYILREKIGEDYFRLELNSKLKIEKPYTLKHIFLVIFINVKKWIASLRSQ